MLKEDWKEMTPDGTLDMCKEYRESQMVNNWVNAEDPGSIPGTGRSPREGNQPTPIFLPGESHGQRSLKGYSPWGHKQLDMTE